MEIRQCFLLRCTADASSPPSRPSLFPLLSLRAHPLPLDSRREAGDAKVLLLWFQTEL